MTGIILAGGNGARMGGRDKARLKLEGETFLARKIRLLKPYCESILVVAAAQNAYYRECDDTPGVRVICDEAPGIGPLMGLYSGLKHSESELNFVATVDSPHLSPALLERLTSGAPGLDVHIPLWRGFPEPLFGVYRKTCLPAIEKVLSEKQRRIVSFYRHVSVGYLSEEEVRRLDPEGLSFVNVNTDEEYRGISGVAD